MQRANRKVIENILLIYPFIYGLQDKIEAEQKTVVSDTLSPAKKIVERLIALDNRRVDLCNLAVLYAFIKRGLGGDFALLERCAAVGADSPLFDVAEKHIRLAGYGLERARNEFGYLFKLIKKKPRSCRAPDMPLSASLCFSSQR